MSWMIAATVAAAGVSLVQANSAANSQVRQANATSRAEGAAIAKERLNYTIRNSYNTALSQMQLGLKKQQLAQQGANISAAKLVARSEADLGAASTNSIGATVGAVVSDINQKAQSAQDMTQSAYENAVENYNSDLKMMVLNTEQSAPTMRPIQDNTQSLGSMVGTAALGGLASFATSYATRKMSLGLGPAPRANVAPPIDFNLGGPAGIKIDPNNWKVGGF